MSDLNSEKIKSFVALAKLVWGNPQNALDKLGLIRDGQILNPARLFFSAKGSRKNKFAELGVEAPVWQGAKT